MKVWKRCLAAVLAFMVFTTSVNISEAAGTYDPKNYIWTATNAEIVAEHYGLGEKETNVLLSEAVNRGYNYILYAPYNNETKGKKDLVAVDYINNIVYAKALHTGGCSWLPVSAVLSAEGEEKEEITLTTGTCYYDDDEYNASQAFTYDGNSYVVSVKYQLHVNISTDEQERLLQIPAVLAQTAKNLEKDFQGMRMDLKNLGDMTPALSKLLTLEFEKEETVVESASAGAEAIVILGAAEETQTLEIQSEEETMAETQSAAESEDISEPEKMIKKVPAFDETEHAEEIAAINYLSGEYEANEKALVLYNMCEEYRNSGAGILEYTFSKGAEVQSRSAELYKHVNILKNSTRFKQVCRELYDVNPALYEELRAANTILKNLIGIASNPGELTNLQNEENWSILDEAVKSQIMKAKYSDAEFADLEAAVYSLKNTSVKVPEVDAETILAAEMEASCKITTYDVSITVDGKVTSGELEDEKLYDLQQYTAQIKLLEGTTEKEIRDAIEAKGIEQKALDEWNSSDSHYEINTNNYDRKETEISRVLKENLEYRVTYSPKEYKVNTNFRGNATLPYGYQMEFPASSDEEISYDYIVETDQGIKISYNEGITYKVTKSVEITQLEGSEKSERRLYDYLISDVQYSMSDEAKQILGNRAVDSPTLNIRVPGTNHVSEVIFDNGVYHVSASEYSSGILGMTWIPNDVYVMDDKTLVEKISFVDGTASWTNSNFTHIKVDYKLKIEKVKSGILNRDLDETEDVLYALNLPYELVKDVAQQNHLLGGTEGTTVKSLYQEMNSISTLMSKGILNIIGGYMENIDGQDAVRRLTSSESKIVKSSSGKKMGNGGWSDTEDQLALYTYMDLCADSEWSLAVYYRNKSYEKIAEQAETVAVCLEMIVEDPGFDKLLVDYSLTAQKPKVENLIPQLKFLASELEGPHKALKVEHEDFSSLIELLISLEGQVEAVDASNGIYAYSSVRKNGEKSGTIAVSVKVGTRAKKIKEFNYILENGAYTLKEEDVEQIREYIRELEEAAKLTEEEKQFYDLMETAIPQAGTVMGKNESVSLVYTPKEYTVTFAGLNKYAATFKYDGDRVIELPAYSDDTDENKYYCYIINGQEKRVNNGSIGYYTFTKEEVLTLFENQHYRAKVQLKKSFSKWDVRPVVAEEDDLIRESYIDLKNKRVFLDVKPGGICENEFVENVKFENGLGESVEAYLDYPNKGMTGETKVPNGATVLCYSKGEDGEEVETRYTIIMMGDVNKDGIVNESDITILCLNYLGLATGEQRILDKPTKLAADMNGNGKTYDSNDALLITRKCIYWDPIDEVVYKSVLN